MRTALSDGASSQSESNASRSSVWKIAVVGSLVLDMIVDEPLVLDKQLVYSMIADELVLHMVVVMEEMCRIVVVEELLKTVDCSKVDCTEVEDCCRMKASCIFSASVRSSIVLTLVEAGVVGVAGISIVPN
ncbi:hypothetical protein Tco_0705535 [Tanacetum coccineum]|uniref:Uncharacterized protein n=1 Tax=Tanacetum coccineum TaxID=301880 RepID=A0ABQ4Y518_9ASTR